MKCQKCGFGLQSGSNFCSKCGAKVEPLPVTPAIMQVFERFRIHFSQVYARVEIEEVPGTLMTVEIDGDEEMKQAIVMTYDNDRVFVTGQLPGVNVLGSYISVKKTNDRVLVDDVYMDPARKLTIKVSIPSISSLAFDNLTVGEVFFKNNITNAFIRIEGTTDVVAKIFGHLSVEISGVGNIYAEAITQTLGINLSGSGNADFNSVIGNTIANISGSGNVSVTTINSRVASFNISGSGNVEITGGDIQKLEVRSSGIGNFDYSGNAVDGELSSSGMGDVSVYYMQNKPIKRETGMGDVRVIKKGWK